MSAPRLKVLMSTGPLKHHDNPYLQQLVTDLSDQVDVQPLSWRTALFFRPDVFHVHWPEQLYRANGRAKTMVKRVLVAILLLRLRARRVPVVLTVHDLAPHDQDRGFERLLSRALERMFALRIYLNESELNDPARGVVILHGDYRGWLQKQGVDLTPREPHRDVILFGLLRRYKGIETLITAARDADATLTIAGRAIDESYERELRALVADVPSAVLDIRHLEDDELTAEIFNHRIVCLPYTHMHNSGALVYALSIGRPVLARRSPFNEVIAREVGEEWVMLYDGPLTAQDLKDALSRTPPAGLPDLSRWDWSTGIALHMACYRGLATMAHDRRPPARVVQALLEAEPGFAAHSAFNAPVEIS
ncbi:GDP-mannose--glycolipid 4-beta-D-mannosyltransferase [Mycolicibacterium aichiense]|uniref:GDP-mannose:glycolipid 4-beta-D-mannosyltransferase n=1 Tax=Mycolicibacterium aichiense TaxID=1799 RepID=A0AAD1HR52_9MYCO|nr:GDP-mannose--glycolipid 4-beta-D-mannosyltransferase [Mycolicibacterium aichiense]MCV7017339.1 GDP-mannose--glycolipid 4-beta-D-mannosyltransferase [Mycolicibacterium aichiense]BBX10227.1 GDP-mannose:glycolipid 4-beta-D-mannosyltransferase [Mycolicibacterium aichiense]STZ26110.1 GDP-mannose:glycolipid 4-beta-D-mannosyltransferase precursor [Mycolicibacterium aichiense]